LEPDVLFTIGGLLYDGVSSNAWVIRLPAPEQASAWAAYAPPASQLDEAVFIAYAAYGLFITCVSGMCVLLIVRQRHRGLRVEGVGELPRGAPVGGVPAAGAAAGVDARVLASLPTLTFKRVEHDVQATHGNVATIAVAATAAAPALTLRARDATAASVAATTVPAVELGVPATLLPPPAAPLPRSVSGRLAWQPMEADSDADEGGGGAAPSAVQLEDDRGSEPEGVAATPLGVARASTAAAPHTFSADDIDTCAVCQADYVDGERLVVLPCLHRYHEACIVPWLRGHRLCPLCKADVMAAVC
jgi:hypothetical protein